MFKKLRVFVACIFVFTLLLQGCSQEKDKLPPGWIGEGFLFNDTLKQNKVIKLIEEQNIPYDIDDRGHVIYPLSYQAEVHGIIRLVDYGAVLREDVFESAVLPDEFVQKKYELAFIKENIPYEIKNIGDFKEIVWNQKYSLRVDSLRERVDMEILEALSRK